LIGFSDVHRRYHRAQLFSAFAERVIGAKRADRPQYLAGLNLAEDADSWEILSASGGYREGDTIELIAFPTIDEATGDTEARFLAHGIRYRSQVESDRISELTPGWPLHLERDPDNEVNPAAIKVVDRGLILGYVPDPLLDYVGAVIDGGQAQLSVVQANPPQTNPHLRLLLRLTGLLPGPSPFDDKCWRTVV
jgi:HIRAN domain